MSRVDFTLERNAFGRLVMRTSQGDTHVGVVPVRAFPIAAPRDGLSLVSAEGREVAWIDRLDTLDAEPLRLIEDELAAREFTPAIARLRSVSSFSTPSTWDVDTDRGATQFVLKGEEDIRRLGGGALMITSSQGLPFKVADWRALDRASRRLLERFL